MKVALYTVVAFAGFCLLAKSLWAGYLEGMRRAAERETRIYGQFDFNPLTLPDAEEGGDLGLDGKDGGKGGSGSGPKKPPPKK